MNSITMKMQADKLIRMALQEDITSEDVSTNAVMRSAVKGTVDLIAKEDGIIAGLDVYARVFQILDEKTEISFNFKDGEAVKKHFWTPERQLRTAVFLKNMLYA